jgi:hypothetical protein
MKRRQTLSARKVGRPEKHETTKHFDDDAVRSLFAAHEAGEDGDPMDSDASNESKDDGEEEELAEDDDNDDALVAAEAKGRSSTSKGVAP